MTHSKKSFLKPVLLTVVLLGAGGLGVAAAKSDGWGRGHCGARHGGYMHGKSMYMPGRHIEGKLAFLKTELKITEDQEQAWEEFAGVMRENARARADLLQEHREERRKAGQESERDERLGLDERIDRRLGVMERHMSMFREMGEAAKKLYAQLTPEQQEIADHMLPSRHHRGRHLRLHF